MQKRDPVMITIVVVLFALCLFINTPTLSAAAPWLEDHMPYWLWADSWEGIMAYEFLKTEHNQEELRVFRREERVSLWSVIELDIRKVENDHVIWHSSAPKALGDYYYKHEASTGKKVQCEVFGTYNIIDADSIDILTISERRAEVDLCEDETGLSIAPKSDQQKGFMAASQSRTIEGTHAPPGTLIPEPLHQSVVLLRGMEASKPLPEPYNRLDVEYDKLGGHKRDIIGGSGGEDEEDHIILAWELDPVHNPAKWREGYEQILREEREEYLSFWEETAEGFSGIVRRAAEQELDFYEEWIEKLLDDADRVLELLLKGEAPDFLIGMSARDSHIADAVIQGPAATMAAIHRHLWVLTPDRYTTSIRRTLRRLPGYMRTIYPTEEKLEPVLIMPGPLK